MDWIHERFRSYYRSVDVPVPSRFGRREFGFMWIGQKFFLRHLGFGSRGELNHFLRNRAPSHAYYSTAYYEKPGESTMREKNWLGADLIFDLDADHLPNADAMSFSEQLAQVKKEAKWLLEEFILGDLGVDRDNVHIVFSGGRGYHFHVTDPRFLPLDSAGRREIVDYVSGTGLVFNDLVKKRTVHVKEIAGRIQREQAKTMPKQDEPGWPGRLAREFQRKVAEIREAPDAESIATLVEYDGIGPKKAETILHKIRTAQGAQMDGLVSVFPDAFLEGCIKQVKGLAKGEADEPVTADIKRLIRLPHSIHGKTGLRVTPLTADEFIAFDPLTDAVVFGEDPVRVNVSRPETVVLGGETITPEVGVQDLPERVALFLILRRRAVRA